MRRLIRIALLSLALIHCATAVAQEDRPPIPEKQPPMEMRHHFEVVTSRGDVLYEATEIVWLSDEADASFLLLRDLGHGDFVLRHVWTFKDQVSVKRISDAKDRVFVQQSYELPYQSKTRLETLAEGRQHPQLFDVPLIFKLETNGGRWDGIQSDWDEHSRRRSLRQDVRRTIDRDLLEAIERMRGTLFGISEGYIYLSSVAQWVVYDFSAYDREQSDVEARDAMPDCSFDEALGFPCSTKQKERVEAMMPESERFSRY